MNAKNSIAELARWIDALPNTRRLAGHELHNYRKQFVDGWRIDLNLAENVSINLLITAQFPFVSPKIALIDRTKFLSWPHVEKDGCLCVFPPNTNVDPYRPVEVAKSLVAETEALLQCLLDGNLDDDFNREFDSYWLLSSDDLRHQFFSILPDGCDSQKVAVWSSSKFRIIGADEKSVLCWLKNRLQKDYDRTDTGFLVKLSKPLSPEEYPDCTEALLALISEDAPNFLESISDHIAKSFQPLTIILAISATNGTNYGVVELCRLLRANEKVSKCGRSNRVSVNGFRDGKAPLSVQLSQQTKYTKVVRSPLERADAEWALGGRGHDPRFAVLQKQRVAIVGLGSFGSFLTDNLIQAGLGQVAMFDGDLMRWENTGRHLLGGDTVGQNKTDALKRRFETNYPTIVSCESNPVDWQQRIETAESLDGFDLVISTTGSWKAECMLNDLHECSGKRTPIVYAWLEPFAAAGHAVAIMERSGCLQCGFTGAGQFSRRVFDWPAAPTTMVSQAGCGNEFQPYGITDSLHSIAMAVDLSVECLLGQLTASTHRVWINKDRKIDPIQRGWSVAWQTVPNFDTREEVVSEFPWSARPDCQRCS
ncbi:thiamine/molybdopterin biosynthesis ThiF/MoeB-like protein [Roseimaritima multifibrata]|uniref:Thiamine/molybdopterin biosynthesis ThiF/MoeB-like protein n=1 Tax=Roseimaritima multifibrata TaxID=1930274 RepID=A0A517M9E1_9BACT|nr:E2/UBC family protein [Roseimaritima multifibrata]QDS91407.1 thiamine/molybdopterin biosynthesis ThiF/MoeB-like protein [Roseimaritima multifibrata]